MQDAINRLLLLATVIPAIGLAAPAVAQTTAAAVPAIHATVDTDAAVRAYWTPERILSARNLDLHMTSMPRHGALRTQPKGARQVVQGGLPTVAFDESEMTFLPEQAHADAVAPHAHPDLVGGSNAPFTTNRLYPVSDVYKSYPYGAIGHLFFTTPNGNFQCTASVIRASMIATAGHCVNDGAGNYYTNWMFIPAQNGNVEPYKTWTWAAAQTTSAWASGGGTVPNEQDDGLIVLAQQKYKGKLHKIGDITGYFGYEYNASLPTAITQIGYPCNLDNCSDPVATYAQPLSGPTNTYLFGTASFGGASGGPEVQDFGIAPSGTPSETLGGNIVVSSTSFTYTTSNYDEDGASVFYAPGQNGEVTFGDVLTNLCNNYGGC
jgi:V8-like Glu-specific endopeptidase